MTVKISDLPSIEASLLISANVSAIPLIAGDANVATYQTSVANVKTYVETGDFSLTGNLTVNGTTSVFENDVTINGILTTVNPIVSVGSQSLSTESSIIDIHDPQIIGQGNITLTTNSVAITGEVGGNLLLDLATGYSLYINGDFAGIIANVGSNVSANLTANSAVSASADPYTLTVPTDDGKDIGIRLQYYKSGYGQAALVWKNSSQFLTYYGSGAGTASNGIIEHGATLGTMQLGQLLVANTTSATTNATGALQVSGGTSIAGNAWVGGQIINTGNITTTGAITAQTLAVNNSTTIGGTLSTVGAVTAQSLAVNTVASIGATLVVTSTATVNALTSNGNITGTNIRGTTGTFSSIVTVNSLISNGSINGTTLVGTGTATVNALVVNSTIGVSGTTTSQDIVPSANISYNIGSSSNRYLNIHAISFVGQSSSSLYADLAEKYEADLNYLPGTVVIFGGTKEITVTEIEQDVRVAGVISTSPAYLMNSESTGLPVALRGKVPVNVVGPVVKGSLLVTSAKAGYAKAILPAELKNDCAVVAKSLTEDLNTEPRAIMAVIV